MLLISILLFYSYLIAYFVYISEWSLKKPSTIIVESVECNPNIRLDDNQYTSNSKYVWKNSKRNINISYLNIRIISVL